MPAPPTTALAASATLPLIVPRSPCAKAIPLTNVNVNAITQPTLIPIERTFPGISRSVTVYWTTGRGLVLHSQDDVNNGTVFPPKYQWRKDFLLLEYTDRCTD